MYLRADAKIEGDLQDLNIRADNSTNFVGKNLTTASCDVLSEGNSDVHVQVTDTLVVAASENSEVFIYDRPKIILNTFSHTAKIHKKEMKK